MESKAAKRRKLDLIKCRQKAETESSLVTAYTIYSSDLRDKLNEALDRLELIALGRYYLNESDPVDTTSDRAKKTASTGLKRIAGMKERRP